MHESIWTASTKMPEFKKLNGDKKTDVLVVGGGLCGILCAYFLHQTGVDYILVEGSKIAAGITKNTTAKITAQHGLIYNNLIRDFGKEKAQMYLTANLEAVKEYEKLCGDVECDFEIKPAYVYSTTDRGRIEDETGAVNFLGFPAEFCDKTELPFDVKGAVCFPNQAQFNPLKFISGISKGLNIYENTFIRDITPHSAIFDGGKISAKKIIVATHFPFINKHGGYFMKLYQHRSYVAAYERAKNVDGMYVDEDIKGLSFRSYNDLLLVGGGSHRTGKQGGCWAEINDFVDNNYSKAKLRYQWATQDCMSLDGVPYIGKYSEKTPDLYVASGFNKWGVTSSMTAARILCDMVQDKKNDTAVVFSPQRNIFNSQLLINGFEAVANLLTPTFKRCPHLGCALKWNKNEHTWDCPCHGSRFEENGSLIDNPATGDANT